MNTSFLRKIMLSLLGSFSLLGGGQVQIVQAEELTSHQVNNDLKSEITFTQGDFTYTVINGGLHVMLKEFSASSELTDVKIPDTVSYNGIKYPVMLLSHRCFCNCSNIKRVQIPSDVYSIGVSCFEGCSRLQTIKIPSKVRGIPLYCFSRCSSLSEVELPSGLQSFAFRCFSDCISLKRIKFPDSVTIIDRFCFEGCI